MERAAIVCCSNGMAKGKNVQLESLFYQLDNMGFDVEISPFLYEEEDVRSGTGRQRAAVLMDYFQDESISHIFDISGGDVSLEILPWLDFEAIQHSSAVFWGYSDLTPVLNAIFIKTGKVSHLYQIRNLIRDSNMSSKSARWSSKTFDRSGIRSFDGLQCRRFQDYLNGGERLFDFTYRFLQGESMSGIMIGGNFRCFLKLAGTPFWPETAGKILFLEGFSGGVSQYISYLTQLKLMGVYEQIQGIVLGTFTEMEEWGWMPSVPELLLTMIPPTLPVAVTGEVGHGADSRAVRIGGTYHMSR